MLGCAAHDLATAPMEGFDADRLRAYLDIPESYAVPLIVATGHAKHNPDGPPDPPSPRFPLGDLFRDGTFSAPFQKEPGP